MLITQSIDDISHIVKQGGVIAYPTEGVYGLGCDPANEQAFERLLACKRRSKDKGVILIASQFSQVSHYLEPLTPTQTETLADSWPGHVTWLIPAHSSCPSWLKGSYTTLAVRVSSHPPVVQLCNHLNAALVSTSANISGQPTLQSCDEIAQYFSENVDATLDLPLGGANKPSRIIDLISGKTIR